MRQRLDLAGTESLEIESRVGRKLITELLITADAACALLYITLILSFTSPTDTQDIGLCMSEKKLLNVGRGERGFQMREGEKKDKENFRTSSWHYVCCF
jgi:hypothetical protein